MNLLRLAIARGTIGNGSGSGGMDAATVSWDQRPTLTADYLQDVTYDPSDYTDSEIADYAPGTAVQSNTWPVGKTVALPAGTLVRGSYRQTVAAAGAVELLNDVPGQVTPWSVLNGSGKVIAAGALAPTGALRWIKCQIAPNVRDLGGWACDGGTVKYGLLFRGGEPGAADKDVLVNQCGVRHELQLRKASEAPQPYSLLGVGYTTAGVDVWYTLASSVREAWKINLRCVFDNVIQGIPVYFHCASGADRTGTLACVLLGLLGVSQSDLDKDYELTCFSTGTSSDSAARRRNETTEWGKLIGEINAKSGSTYRDKVVRAVLEMGFTLAEINAYRAAMIDGTPATVTAEIASYTVSNSLTHAANGNAAQEATQYQPYEAVITPESGYVIESVSVTMGGSDVTGNAVSKVYNALGECVSAAVRIESASGNISITAVGVAETPAYTNLFDPSTASLNKRFNTSNAEIDANGYFCTASIPCDQSGGYKTLRVKGAGFGSNSKILWSNSSGTVLSSYMKVYLNVQVDAAGVSSLKVGWYESTQNDPSTDHESSNSSQIRSIRLALQAPGTISDASSLSGVIITLDEEIS